MRDQEAPPPKKIFTSIDLDEDDDGDGEGIPTSGKNTERPYRRRKKKDAKKRKAEGENLMERDG